MLKLSAVIGIELMMRTKILGWAGLVRVDGAVYRFLGAPGLTTRVPLANQTSSKFTSTQSTFVLRAGGIDLTVNFLSPVEPTDLVKQSVPFAYLSVAAASNDGKSHSVHVYTDISAEWVTGDNNLHANWSTSTTGNIITHQVSLQDQEPYAEDQDHIRHGSAYYSILASAGVTYRSGVDVEVRESFVANGTLDNTLDTNFRAVNDKWPVFAFAKDMGSITSTTSAPVVFSIGHVRDPAVRYIIEGGSTQDRSAYYWSVYSSVSDMISEFLNDYPNALSRANALDAKISADAAGVSSNYASIVALSIRQAFATFEITISKKSDGSWDLEDTLVFMKEISSNGNTNTVDVIFPAWPLFLYANPTLGRDLLLPHFRYQATGQYPNTFAIHDLGAHYPVAIGHNDGRDEHMPLEECGNMLIMTLSHYQKTGDTSIISKYYNLLDQWTQYLVEEALIPANQISTDDFAGPLINQTNLAIKGIIGIRAMADIACIMGNHAQSENYTSISHNYANQFIGLSAADGGQHLTLNYGNSSSWGLTYNLYAEKLLGFEIFPQSIYQRQDSWYPSVLQTFGVPLDTRHTYTKTDWMIWMAAIATSPTTRNMFIDSIYKFASNGDERNNVPFSDWYDTITGLHQGFRARPVVGGHLALMKGVLPTSSRGSSSGGTCFVVSPTSSGQGQAAETANGGSGNEATQKRLLRSSGLLVTVLYSILLHWSIL
ncbi:hypothetical protein FRC17_004075 [Serendipita sp. 399]|nr:hypothetical protein FRC17_004075 [Serendipita sp. 399]